MSALAEQQLQFQTERRRRTQDNTMEQLEQYRVKYEEMQVTAVAAQMEVTSLQFQLDKAKKELGRKTASIHLLVDQLNTQKSLNAEKEKKLEAFQQKLGTIKAAVRKELDKKRSGDRTLQLVVNSLLLCCQELRTNAISVDDFHSATDLILSTLPLPHHHQHTSTSSHTAVVFGEDGRRQLESLPLDQRQARLAELVGTTEDVEGVGGVSSRSPSPTPLVATPSSQLSQFESVSSSGGHLSVVCNGMDDEAEEVRGGREGKVEEGGEREEGVQEEVGGVVLGSDSTHSELSLPSRRHLSEPQFPVSQCLSPPPPRTYSLSSPGERRLRRSSPVLSRRPSWLEKRQSRQQESVGGPPRVRSMSADVLRPRSRSLGAESEKAESWGVPEDYAQPQEQLQVWRRRLGVTEGSIFTGSLPHINHAMEEEEEEDIGGGEYLDPREIASAIVSRKVSRRVSQRMQRRVNTLLSAHSQPVYLRLVGAGDVEETSEDGQKKNTAADSPYVPMASHLKGTRAWTHVWGGGGREGGSWFDPEPPGGFPSSYTSDCDGSSVDWDAKDDEWEGEENVYATIPDWWERGQEPGGGKEPRERGARMVKQASALSTASGEGIYAIIDELGVSRSNSRSNGIKTSHSRPYSEQVSSSPSKTSSLDRHMLHLKGMKSLDGYEYLDTPLAPPLPPWQTRPRPTLPPRKKSAPVPGMHVHAHSTIPVLDSSPAPYSPAMSSDENVQSDGEQPAAGLYTTGNFITMEKRPHPPGLALRMEQEGNKQMLRRATHSPGSRVRLEGQRGGGGGEEEEEQWRGGHMVLRAQRSKTFTVHSKPKSQSKLVEHSGYLAKVDGRLRAGKRRWFVLKGSELKYYKNKEGSFGRPRKTINLSSWCKLALVDQLSFKLTTSSHTYHLAAATRGEREGWVGALQAVLKSPSEQLAASTPSLTPNDAPSLTGWAHITKNSQNQRMWCSLANGVLRLSPSPSNEPLQSVNMCGSVVRKVRDSLIMDNKESSSSLGTQLSVQEEGQPHPLLITPERLEDKEVWFYQLSLASNRGQEESLELTTTEQQLATIVKEGEASDHPLWKHPVLNVTEGPLRSSLTSLCSAALVSKAVRLFQSVQIFVSTPISPLALGPHIAAVQHLISTCLRHRQLQSELYCQVLRQLAGHKDSNNRSLLQGWYLLSLLLPMFLPHRPRISWYLQTVLERTAASPLPTLANFAQQCLSTLEQVEAEGPRKWRPSYFELQGLLSCYAHLPSTLCARLHLPVQLPDGTTQELEFSPSTTVQELVSRLNEDLKMPDVSDSGFALMSDWPGVEECAFFFLPFQSKLCDLISCWMAAAEELGQPSSKPHRLIQLSYRNRLFLKCREGKETEQEAIFLAYQLSREVVSGRHPVSSLDEGMKMAAIMAQIEYGDWESMESGGGRREEVAREALLKFAPTKFTHMTLEYSQSLYQLKMTEEWCQYAGRSKQECARDYLSLARQWNLCGATLFLAEDLCSSCDVWLAVHEEGVCLLCLKSLEHLASYSYSQLSAFGGDGDNLVLVTSSSSGGHGNTEQLEKLLLAMPKAKIHQATDLMTSYLKLASDSHQ